MKFSKVQLDQLTNFCGLVIGVMTVLVANNYIPAREGATISGLAGAVACWLTNKPALKHPTTEDLEEDIKT